MSAKAQETEADIAERAEHRRWLIYLLSAAGIVWGLWTMFGMEVSHFQLRKYVVNQVAKSASAPISSALAPTRAELAAEVGQSGDAYGGMNALFTALVAAFAAWAGLLQYTALNKARHALAHEHAARRLEQFESRFFRMLDLTRELVQRFEFKPRGNPVLIPDTHVARVEQNFDKRLTRLDKKRLSRLERRSGAAALDAFADVIDAAVQSVPEDRRTLRELDQCFNTVFRSHASSFGPYFRLLYETFRSIDAAEISGTEKRDFAAIARGQIGDAAVLLLALYGLSIEGRRFVFYIEQFGLLQHMHNKYMLPYFHLLCDVVYRGRAFALDKDQEKFKFEPDPLKYNEVEGQTVSDILTWENVFLSAAIETWRPE